MGVSGEDGSVMVTDEVAPARHGNLGPDAHEAQAGLDEDGGREVGRGHHGDGGGQVGQDVTHHDAGGR